ncbi:hypothetical protein HOP61_09470 [Halomonas daqingensis]|uniref:Uncharacterized protein n=1 Tax=Billgrantia desiderata TaxID=52021 RepID=A0AAW4YUG1_9GAMM|nr:hypothetical protein [Halomonas desiderata]MCE8051520.1 hypothetical protein [Halomonas desiderata]
MIVIAPCSDALFIQSTPPAPVSTDANGAQGRVFFVSVSYGRQHPRQLEKSLSNQKAGVKIKNCYQT